MVLELVDEFHPILKQKMETFDFKNPPCDPIELANNLIETMHHHKGLGLSANQCGLPYNVFALWSGDPLVCFNPRIVDETTERIVLDEGCLTYPHMFLKIKRAKVIKVRFQNVHGDVYNEKFIGMTARTFQHELDHLQGKTFLSRASPIHIQRARNQQKHLLRSAKRGELSFKEMKDLEYDQYNIIDRKKDEQEIQIQ